MLENDNRGVLWWQEIAPNRIFMSDAPSNVRYGNRIENIQTSGARVDESIDATHPLYIPNGELEALLHDGMVGCDDFARLPIKSRSKMARIKVCQILGYDVPRSFPRASGRARLAGQDLDVFVQKSNNLQVWNKDLVSTRRYAVVALDDNECVVLVRVVYGADLASLATSSTRTHKHQARIVERGSMPQDTDMLAPWLGNPDTLATARPTDAPCAGSILPMPELIERIKPLVGKQFKAPARERVRGDLLHREVALLLGYPAHSDSGRFPDILHQLLEVKAQFSETIDLGQVDPISTDTLVGANPMSVENPFIPRRCDVRYVVFLLENKKNMMCIKGLLVSNGENFYKTFKKMGGTGVNAKQQIHLPKSYFTPQESSTAHT